MIAEPLVTYTSTVTCDECRQSATLTFDGLRFDALTSPDGYYAVDVERDLAEVSGQCPRPITRDGVQCGGVLVWDLTTDGAWS